MKEYLKRHVWLLLILLFGAFLTSSANAGLIAGATSDTTSAFGAVVLHDAIGPAPIIVNHPLPPELPPGNWIYSGGIREVQGIPPLTGDRVSIDAQVLHETAPPANPPHGELKNEFDLDFDLFFTPTNAAMPGPGIHLVDRDRSIVPHNGHFDVGNASLAVSVAANGLDIDSYGFVEIGIHTENIPAFGKIVPDDDNPYVSGVYIFEFSTNLLTLSLGVFDVSLADLDAAHIRLGSANDPGPIIFDLEPALFFDLDGLGVGRIILAEEFPQMHVNSLLAGNTFLEIQTPGEDITGMMMSVAPEPSAFVLFAVGILGIIGMSYRRRNTTAVKRL